jgi:hypothetical protein
MARVTKDYQSIIREGLHVELAEWLQAKRRRSMPKVKDGNKKPRMRLWSALDPELQKAFKFLSVVFIAWIVAAILISIIKPLYTSADGDLIGRNRVKREVYYSKNR